MKRFFSVGFIYINNVKVVGNLFYSQNSRIFKRLEIPGLVHNEEKRKPRYKLEKLIPRYTIMKGNEDWVNVWPAAMMFNQNAIPLPIRQGYVKNSTENNKIKPSKYGNAELMKIPNFLHLTPLHIEKHCKALKTYCTKWPKELDESTAQQLLPLEFIQTDYIHSASSIRDPRARCVTMKLELRHLHLNEREKFKFIHLVGLNRYDKQSDSISLTADRCPSYRQNYDYLIYVLTALTRESKKFESWELQVEESDWLKYQWEKSAHKDKPQQYHDSAGLPDSDVIERLKNTVEAIYNEEESTTLWDQYKRNVIDLLQLVKSNDVTPEPSSV